MTHDRPLTLPERCRLAASGASEPRYELWHEVAGELERLGEKNAVLLRAAQNVFDVWDSCATTSHVVSRMGPMIGRLYTAAHGTDEPTPEETACNTC